MNITGLVGQAGGKLGSKAAPVVAKVGAKSPVILCVVGGAAVIAGTVLACRATLKTRDKVETNLEVAEAMKADMDACKDEETAEDLKVAIRKVHVNTGLTVARAYILPACLIVSGIVCFAIARNIEHTRLLGTIAALDAVNLQFEDYRRNVIEDQGPAADLRYMTGDKNAKAEFYEEGEDGKVKKLKKDVTVRDKPADMFCFLFDDCNSTEWKKEAWRNREFFENQLVWATRKKYSQGHVIFYEVLRDMGFSFEPWTTQWEWKLSGDMDVDERDMFEIVERYMPEEVELAREERRNPEPSFWIEFKGLTPVSDHYLD